MMPFAVVQIGVTLPVASSMLHAKPALEESEINSYPAGICTPTCNGPVATVGGLDPGGDGEWLLYSVSVGENALVAFDSDP